MSAALPSTRSRADGGDGATGGPAPSWTLAGGLVLVTSLLVGAFALLASALELRSPLSHDREWSLYLLTLVALAPGALVGGRLLARRVDAAAGAHAVEALAAISAAGILAALIVARAWFALGHRSSAALLALALLWAVAVAVMSLRALRGRAIGAQLFAQRAGARSPWLGVALLAFVAALAFYPPHFFGAGRALAAILVTALLVVAHERRPATAPAWTERLLDAAVLVAVVMIVTDVSGYHEYLRPDARTAFAGGLPIAPDLLANLHRFHQDLWLGPLNDMLGGRTLLVDTTSQYGAGALYFLAGYFQIAPLGYGALGLLTGVLTALQFALAYGVLRLAGVGRALAIPAIAAAVLGLVMGVVGSFNDFPSAGAMRFGIPWAVVVVTLLAALRPQRHRALWIAAGAVVAVAAIWSFETFAYTAATFTTAAAFDAACTHRGRRWIVVVVRRVVAVAVLCVALYALLVLATRVFSGSWPDASEYLAYLSVYSSGAQQLYIVTGPWTPGLAMALVHLASLLCLGALVARRHELVAEQRPALTAIAAINGLGIVSFSYWVGNSAYEALFYMGLPVLVAAALWLSLVTREHARVPAALRLVGLAAGLWFAATLGLSGWQETQAKWRRTALAHALPFGGDHTSLPSAVSALWHNPISDRRALVGQALLARHLPRGAPALVIMEPDLTVETLVRSGRINVLPFADPEQENLIPDQIDPKILAAVDALAPNTLMLTQPAAWSTPVKRPAATVPNGLLRVQRLALDRIRSRFDLQIVERGADGLAIVALRHRAGT